MARTTGRRTDRPSPMQTLVIALAWFASARRSVNSVAWRIEQDSDGSVIIMTDGDAPGLCITPEDAGYGLLAWDGTGEESRSGPYGSFEAALRAALKILRADDHREPIGRFDH